MWMRLHDVADIVLGVQEELLLPRCGRRRATGRRPARHPVLRHEPRARVRCRRAPAVPRRLSRRRDAVAVRRLQHVREVRRAPRPGTPPVRVRGGRDRPLRAARRRTGRPGAAATGARRGQGPDLLPVRPAPGPAGPRPVPAGRADQAGGPRGGTRARPRHRRQAREPGDLLRPRRRLPRRPAGARGLGAGGRSAARRRTGRGWGSTAARPPTPSASARASASPSASRAT